MLTHDGRRTTVDEGRQPIAIGHLSDSGDLKNLKRTCSFNYKKSQLIHDQTINEYTSCMNK